MERKQQGRWPIVLLIALATAACGAPEAAEKVEARVDPLSRRGSYGQLCIEFESQRARELESGRYHPPTLMLHRWPNVALSAPNTPSPRSEAEFIELLAAGGSRATLLVARGGTGKSKLGWSLESALCGRLPVVRVDLQWDVNDLMRTLPKGENPIVAAAMRKLSGDASAGEGWAAEHIGDRPWLLLLDSLDEVALQHRVGIADAINAALKRYPQLRVMVSTRPPVFTGTYGLRAVDAMVELPQLECARTDAAMAELVPDKERREGLQRLLRRYGLDRKATTPDGRCYYPHLSTYRDFFVVERIAQNFSDAGASMADQLEPSRAHVYAFYLEVSLIKDLQGVALSPKAALALVDRLVEAGNPSAGTRNLFFTVDQCLANVPGSNDDERRAICERLLQSSLFEPAPHSEGQWKLKNQSIYDLFLARFTDREIAARKTSPCGVIDERSALFESNEVAGFLVGLAGGQRCLLAVVRQLCRAGGYAQHHFEQLDQGLPAGVHRKKLLDDATRGMDDALQPHLCVGATIDRLYKVGSAPIAPADVPAPPKPGD